MNNIPVVTLTGVVQSQHYDAGLAKTLRSVPAAIIYWQLWFWHTKTKRRDGYFWKTVTELTDETGLTSKQVRLAIEKLKKAGIIDVKLLRAMGHATNHYKILKAHQGALVSYKNRTKQPVDNSLPDSQKGKLGVPKGQTIVLPKGQTNNSLNTHTNTQSYKPVKLTDEEKARRLENRTRYEQAGRTRNRDL